VSCLAGAWLGGPVWFGAFSLLLLAGAEVIGCSSVWLAGNEVSAMLYWILISVPNFR
jgi:hypothetical protein